MKLFLKPPITDISWLKSLPQKQLITEVIHNTDKRLLAMFNQLLTNQKQRLIMHYNFEAPRYVIYLRDQHKQQQIVTLQRGILWVDEDKKYAFDIGNDLWEYFEKLSQNVPMAKIQTFEYYPDHEQISQ